MSGSGVQFDMTVNLNLVVGIVVWIVTVAVGWTKIGGRIDMIDLRLTLSEKVLERLALTLEKFSDNEMEIKLIKAELAALQTQFATLHKTVELMRVGEGYIEGPRRANLSGEYSRTSDANR